MSQMRAVENETSDPLCLSPFLTLYPTSDPLHWTAHAETHLCVGRPDRAFLFGGAAFAACIDVMERSLAKPITYASAQFVSFARPGEKIALEVRIVADGNNMSQAQVAAYADDRLFIAVQGALGTRQLDLSVQSITMPAVAAPDQCNAIPITRILSARMNALFEIRPAAGRMAWAGPWSGPAEGPIAFWAHARNGAQTDRRMLAELADLIAIGIPSAIGHDASANSLDNHIRFIRVVPSEWVLCTITIDAADNGIVHGTVRLFHPEGTLMAIASQSMLLRLWRAGKETLTKGDALSKMRSA